MRIKINDFGGELPRYHAAVLPNKNAEAANNCRFEAGVLQSLYGYSGGDTLVLTGHIIQSIHLWRVAETDYWLRFADKVSVIRSPIADDSYRRIYWSGDSRLGGCPKYSYTPAVYTGSTQYPANYFKLGIPAPTNAPTVALIGTIDDTQPTETRVYIYTYVGKLGEESSPSPASSQVICNLGQHVNVDNLVIDTEASTGREIENIRIYRVAVGSSGNAEYLFVDQIAISASLPYEDSKTTDQLAEAIQTTTWTEPRSDMQGIGLTAYGVAYGFSGKIICLSEPFVPYAWPRQYELTTDYDIVAIGHYDSYMIVGTKGRPYMVTGTDPASTSMMELPIIESCVSAQSMVSMGAYAIYASPNGLVMATSGGAQLITANIVTKREWDAITPPSIHAYQHKGKYVFFWYTDSTHKGGYIFDPNNPSDGFVAIDWFKTGFRDIETDTLWLLDSSDQLHKFDDNNSSQSQYLWKSKKISLDKPHCFTAGRVLADSYTTGLTLRIYGDGELVDTITPTDTHFFRFARLGRRRVWQVEITGLDTVREICLGETVSDLQV